MNLVSIMQIEFQVFLRFPVGFVRDISIKFKVEDSLRSFFSKPNGL